MLQQAQQAQAGAEKAYKQQAMQRDDVVDGEFTEK